jgi:hypothetical protein
VSAKCRPGDGNIVTPVTERVPCPPYSGLNAVGVATSLGATLAESGRGTMGLLMSDRVLIDPLLDETLRRWDDLGDWAYTLEMSRDVYEFGSADSTE